MKSYVARCKRGKVVAMAIADSPLEQAECARDVKRWVKSGLSVKLVAYGPKTKKPEWCLKDGRGRCARCEG